MPSVFGMLLLSMSVSAALVTRVQQVKGTETQVRAHSGSSRFPLLSYGTAYTGAWREVCQTQAAALRPSHVPEKASSDRVVRPETCQFSAPWPSRSGLARMSTTPPTGPSFQERGEAILGKDGMRAFAFIVGVLPYPIILLGLLSKVFDGSNGPM
eukprot:4153512-Pleurochrysis_carterae.AAC.1